MADQDVYRTILPKGTVITASGNTGPILVGSNTDPATLDVVPVISAVSGTSPNITFTVQRAADAVVGTFPPASWTAGVAGTAQTTAARSTVSHPHAIAPKTGTNPAYYRVAWAVTGTTPSFTLALYGK